MSFKKNRNVVYSCKYDVFFCPKYRRKVLVPRRDGRLKEIIGEVCGDARCELIEREVMPDHVHRLLDCDPPFGINRLVRSIKGRSSRLLRQAFPKLKSQRFGI